MANELEMDKIREENRQKTIDTLLEPKYFFQILLGLFFLVLFYIDKKNKNNQYRY